MKALLLSAGIGERLRPLTNQLPKVMVSVNGKPCLLHSIENLNNQGVTEFAINTHYLASKIKDFFSDGSKFGITLSYSYEPELLGTAGALNNFRDFFDSTFIVSYGDVIANFDLNAALKIHKKYMAEATIIVDSKRSMIGRGAVLFDKDQVIDFIEKPKALIPNAKINSGFYILEPSVLKSIPQGYSDFGKEILPILSRKGSVYCYEHKGYIFDIGKLEDLISAEEFLKNNS